MVIQPIESSYSTSGEYTIPAYLRHTADEALSTKASTCPSQLLARPEIVVAPAYATALASGVLSRLSSMSCTSGTSHHIDSSIQEVKRIH